MFLKTSNTSMIDLAGTHITALCVGKPDDNEEIDYNVWHLIVIHNITEYRKMWNVKTDTDLLLLQNFRTLNTYAIPDNDYSSYTIIQKCESRWLGDPFIPLINRIQSALEDGCAVCDISNESDYIGIEEAEALVKEIGAPNPAEEQTSQLLAEGEKPDCDIPDDSPDPKDTLKKL